MKIIKKNLTWKDKWINQSPASMTEMFYKVFKKLPTKDELRKFIDIFVIPKNQKELEIDFKNFVKLMGKNERKGE